MAVDRTYFVDVFGEIVNSLEVDGVDSIYYMYGHAKEIANRLDLKDQSSIDKFNKFPLVWLVTDLKESETDNYNHLYSISTPQIFIVTSTKPNYISEQRTENTFKPTLNPIYKALKQAVIDSNLIDVPTGLLEGDKYDRYAWGSASVYGNDKLIFNDWLDAIEWVPNEINVFTKPTNC